MYSKSSKGDLFFFFKRCMDEDICVYSDVCLWRVERKDRWDADGYVKILYVVYVVRSLYWGFWGM